jgi:hypothetical protein
LNARNALPRARLLEPISQLQLQLDLENRDATVATVANACSKPIPQLQLQLDLENHDRRATPARTDFSVAIATRFGNHRLRPNGAHACSSRFLSCNCN